jgi:hypothetical protein
MRGLLLAIVIGATGAGVAMVHERLVDRREQFPEDLDVLYVPPPDHLRVLSLGYKEALADLVWIRALIFSGEKLGSNDIDAVTRYVDAITGLSPRFHRAYVWGAVTIVYGGEQAIDREMVDRSIEIYRRGIDEFPESHALLYPLGMLLHQQVPSTPGYTEAEREALRREGIELIRKAAAFGADPLVRRYAATLVSDSAATDQLAIQFLEAQLAQTEDEAHRRLLRRKLAQLGGEEALEAVERIRHEFKTEHLERAPYLPDALYAVLRAEPGPFTAEGSSRARESR